MRRFIKLTTPLVHFLVLWLPFALSMASIFVELPINAQQLSTWVMGVIAGGCLESIDRRDDTVFGVKI